MSVLGTHLYQCSSWRCVTGCIRPYWTFLKTLSKCLPISWWEIYECTCPYCTESSAVFDQTWHDPRAPPSLFTWSCPERLFFFLFFWMKKVLKGKPFADVEEVLKKGRSTKRHQNKQVQLWIICDLLFLQKYVIGCTPHCITPKGTYYLAVSCFSNVVMVTTCSFLFFLM